MLTIKQHRPAATWPMVKRIWCLTIWELNGMFHKIEHVLLSWARLYERLNMWKLSVLIHATNLCQFKYQILVITETFQKWNWFNLPTTWEWFYLQLKSAMISILVKTLVTGLRKRDISNMTHIRDDWLKIQRMICFKLKVCTAWQLLLIQKISM